jgi:potassium inwardly-rectifying channel subfamily J
MTIGYGVPDPYFHGCESVMILLTCEVLVQITLDAVLIGIVYDRFSRGQTRASTVLFSDRAVLRRIGDGVYFMFQVCELRKTQLIDCKVRCYVFSHDTVTGSIEQTNMRLQYPDDTLGSPLLLAMPAVVVHRVDAWSPLLPKGFASHCAQGKVDDIDTDLGRAMSSYYFPAPLQREADGDTGDRTSAICPVCGESFPNDALLRTHVSYQAKVEELEERTSLGHGAYLEHLQNASDGQDNGTRVRNAVEKHLGSNWCEIVCLVEGCEPTTSANVQAVHSYKASDIVWDRMFTPCVSLLKGGGASIDFAKFHHLELVGTDEIAATPSN